MSEQRETEDNKRNRGRTANNKTTTGFRISNELWAVLEPILPAHVNKHRFGGGRPRVADRKCADGIFYVMRTGYLAGVWIYSPYSIAGEEAQALKKEAGFRARRWVVERTHSWMNRFRRILVRWEKKAENYAAFLHFAYGLIAFRASGLFG